ncbi:hypothetical protein CERSUDRAFT_93030 [Gelatoporia subvermispora B]|uniref:VPS9 domain-containing protein n=1 Tax=Ceriporiopsis subvermispora (strain B) TaxID=914234 RepID=M2R389_CERS8|nr:hypothetical protein CERSUDRAFT_93030 [Gelatoporia subvermispora B]
MSKRDSLFLSGAAGRSGAAALPHNGSHESLHAHPLLSPTPSISPSDSPARAATPPRYVPYTPRQRVAPTSAMTTAGATSVSAGTVSAPQIQQHPGDAASKLQLMHLKAAAQSVGLDTQSTGWAILERLAIETDHGPEWNEIWNAIAVGKATLLLPLEPYHTNEAITPEYLKDYVAFCDPSAQSQSGVSVVTLSGLRGSIVNDTLTIRSTLSPTSKPFQALFAPSTRSSAFAALPSLPLPLTPLNTATYPAFPVFAHTPGLPLPPRPLAPKPPLPPRPGARVASVHQPPAGSQTSRLSNPFASLFGRSAASPTPPASPQTSQATLQPEPAASVPSTSPPGSAPAASSSASDTEHALSLPAYAIATRISRTQVGPALYCAITAELQSALEAAGVPQRVRERVEAFASRIAPLVRGSSNGAATAAVKKLPAGLNGRTASGSWRVKSEEAKKEREAEKAWVVNTSLEEEDAEELARRFQEFYYEVEEDVRKQLQEQAKRRSRGHVRLASLEKMREKLSDSSPSGSGDEGDALDKEKQGDGEVRPEGEESKIENRTVQAMDAIERALCSLFYDRLFLFANSDDASHDEALSSRIAAVNLLDLGLTHLGVDVGEAGPQVEAVVSSCGQTLMRLDSACRAPADKAALLVSVHKTLVDGLGKLPPIRLKSDDEETLEDKTPRAARFTRSDKSDEEDEGELKPRAQRQASEGFVQSPTIILSPDETSIPSPIHPPDPITPSPLLSPNRATTALPSLPPRRTSPDGSAEDKSASPTPVSGDIILPLMIFAVVKANPPRLVSNLLYTQRFRREGAGSGEEGYCLINLMAVAEFLENVDLAALGLGESEKTVLSAASLTPIPLTRSMIGSEPSSPHLGQASLRGRVEQQVDAIAGSANKVISGVVDSSFGVLRALLPGQTPNDPLSATDQEASKPIGFGLLRRDTGFSIASIAASLPTSVRSRSNTHIEENGQQMVEVPSRPGSSRSMRPDEEGTTSEDEDDDEDEEEEEEEEYEEHDTRSIRSFESMMSSRSRQRRKKVVASRKSLTDRLASMPGLSRLSQSAPQDQAKEPKMHRSPPASRRSSMLLPSQIPRTESPTSSRAASPIAIRISPPNPRFLSATEDDIKVSEVGELLKEYKRLVEAVTAMGGFAEA